MKRMLLLVGILFSSVSVMASENVLQSIEIVPVKDTYNIVLVSDKAVDVKKEVQASNKITLTMKDIRASKTLNTVYNNVSNVDTVMVEPSGNGISIFFQAENASASSVTFDSIVPIVPIAKTSKSLKLNNPIDSYAPIYKDEFQPEKTSKLFDKLKSSQTVGMIKDSIDEETAGEAVNKTVSFGLVGLLIFAVLRLFKRREPEMQIGLKQNYAEREMDMHRNSFINNPMSHPERSLASVNYGINAYKNENRNPYETAPMHFHSQASRNYTQPNVQEPSIGNFTKPAPQVATQTAVKTKKMTTPVNSAPVNQSNPNIDNLKFLESMTAIYEKSGRHDLARGLKASLSKNNIK